MLKYLLTSLLCIYLLFTSQAIAEEAKVRVMVYVYHLQPPLIIDLESKRGLYFEFVERLNKLSDKYEFEVAYIPRKRIERMLDSQSMQGVLLGVNPIWFKDKNETRYLWTSSIINDRDEMVSLRTKPIEFNGPDSLAGKIIGGVRGFYYYGINELVSADRANRVDTVSEPDLLTMLIKQRVEIAIIGSLTFDYMVKKNNWQEKFYLSNTPHDIFERKILTPLNMNNVHRHLQKLTSIIKQDEGWKASIVRYR
ncbi:hypothetical protein [Colwellia sp. 12G3]|uniref:hypothetical protein n=1 Tax=Colwellia sp. 12G3 TaxID=2058299 RepID=UPI000C34509F|nr:hypothetical protein [Colwellia sp. 12G3]PKI13040.1 hypothetical protein CXF71_20265 [Colwellia sp. 12G3]